MTQSQYTPAFHYQNVNKIIEENLKLFIQRFKMLLIVHSHTFQRTYGELCHERYHTSFDAIF